MTQRTKYQLSIYHKLDKAYKTLYDENQRKDYDERYWSSRPRFSSAQKETPREKASRERKNWEEEEEEWMERERVRTEKITRLEKKIETIAADLTNEMERSKREMLKKDKTKTGWWRFITSLRAAQNSAETAGERSNKLREELRLAQSELKRFKNEKAEVQRKRSDIRVREERERDSRKRVARAREEKETRSRQQ